MPRIAMQPEFPTFAQAHLQSFLVCSCFELTDNALSKLVKQLDSPDERETRFDSGNGPAWIRVRIGPRRQDGPEAVAPGRFQVDCALESTFSPSRADEDPRNSPEQVQEYLRLVLRQKAGISYCCEGRFLVPKAELPMRGFVGLLHGASASVGNTKMNLIGATLDVQGCPPFGEVRWRRKRGTGGGKSEQLDITISAFPDESSSVGRLDKVAEMLSSGLKKLVTAAGE
jgi:hypothetical protein